MNESASSFYFFKNQEVAIITKAKVASRFSGFLFSSYYDPYGDDHYLYLTKDGNCTNPIYSTAYSNYDDIIRNNIPVYFLYRNPIKRYYSGVMEDLFTTLNDNQLNFSFYLTPYIEKFKLNPFEILYNFSSNNKEFLIENKKYILFFKSLIQNYIKWQTIFKPIVTEHTDPYLKNTYELSNKLANPIYVNIDDDKNNLPSIFFKYSTLSKSTDMNISKFSQSSKNFHKIIEETFNETDEYINIKDLFTKSELNIYDMLESHERNILNLR